MTAFGRLLISLDEWAPAYEWKNAFKEGFLLYRTKTDFPKGKWTALNIAVAIKRASSVRNRSNQEMCPDWLFEW